MHSNTPHAHVSPMAGEVTDPGDQSEDDSSISAPPYSPLTVSSSCSEVLYTDDDREFDSEEKEFDSEEKESISSEVARGDPIG